MIQLLAVFILVAAGQAEDSCADGSCAMSRQLLQLNSESSGTELRGDEEWGESAPSACTTAGSAGVGAGQPCIFPFTYKRNTYAACAVVDHSTPWCSTQVDGNGEFIVAKWGECSSSCLRTTTTTTIITSPSTPVSAGSYQIPVSSAVGIKVGDLITLNKATLLQAQAAGGAKKWWVLDGLFGSSTSGQKPATYVVQNVILGSDGVGGTVELDRKLDQDIAQGAKIVVSSPPPTTTTTTPAPTTTTSTTTTTPAPTTVPTTTTTTTTPAPTTTTSTTTTTPAPTTVPTTTEVTTVTTTTKKEVIVPVVVNASKTAKFKLKLMFKK